MTQPLEYLDRIIGRLDEIYSQFRPGTIQHAGEIIAARREKPHLRSITFWTADFPLYRVEDSDGRQVTKPKDEDDVVLYLARRENNLLFQNIQEGCRQLIEDGNYVPKQDDIDRVVRAETTLKVKLSDLNLKENRKDTNNEVYFNIEIENPDALNKPQRTLAERVYGSGDDFAENLTMRSHHDNRYIRFYLLNPSYVKEKVGEKIPALSRAGYLNNLINYSDFHAWARHMWLRCHSLRGVLKGGDTDAK